MEVIVAKRAKAKIAHEEFVFRVSNPSLDYAMSLIDLRYRSHPFEEDVTLKFTATCIYPDHFKDRSATATLRGYRNFLARIQNPQAELPGGVASIVATKAQFEFWADVPYDSCWQIAAAMSAGSIRSMLANAPAFTPKHSFINSISFHGPDFDPVAYVG
jgi:hypothetical protein